MKNAIEALLIVWPSGIPKSEYERAVALVNKAREWDAPRTERQPAFSTVVSTKGPKWRRPSETLIGAPGLKKLRAAMETGPATAKELVEVTGLSESSAWAGLRQIGERIGDRQRPDRMGTPAGVYALKKAGAR
jgi:hypothetical protein